MNVYGSLFLAVGVFCGNVVIYGLNQRGIFVGSLAAIITFAAIKLIKSR